MSASFILLVSGFFLYVKNAEIVLFIIHELKI